MELLSYLAGLALLLLQPVISTPIALPADDPSPDTFNPDSDTNSNINCPSGVQIIAARGTTEHAGLGAMQSLANDIMDKIPNSKAIGLRYPAKMKPSYSNSEETGVDHMKNYVRYFNQHCPKTKLVLLGYSQVGSQVLWMSGMGTNAGCRVVRLRWMRCVVLRSKGLRRPMSSSIASRTTVSLTSHQSCFTC